MISSRNYTRKNNIKYEMTKPEEKLYNFFVSEYNDIFENILNYSFDFIFTRITKNILCLLGKEKYESYPPELIKFFKDKLYTEYMKPNLSLIENIKFKKSRPLPPLNIDTILAHCQKCYDSLHTCGEKLYIIKDINIIICLKCNKIYKPDMIRLFCHSCNEEYFSYMINDKDTNDKSKEGFILITWDKYHCENFISEEIKCPKCSSMVYFNDEKKLLKCFECNWTSKAKEQMWTCEICGKKFQSALKEYYKYETKPLLNCIKFAIIKKIIVKPCECLCCNEDPFKLNFIHNKSKGCNGVLYLSYLNRRPVIVCSKCKIIKKIPNMTWECPNCGSLFKCRGIIYMRKKNKKNLSVNKIKVDRIGSYNKYKKSNVHKNYIIVSNLNNMNDNNLNFVSNNKIKRMSSSFAKFSRNNFDVVLNDFNDSIIEEINNSPQKIMDDFPFNEYYFYTKNNNYFFNSNFRKIVRNNTMINIQFNTRQNLLNPKSSNKKKNKNKSPEGQNIEFLMNRNNSRQHLRTIFSSQLSDDSQEEKSNSMNNNAMKLVKKRLVFMEPTQTIIPNEYEIMDKIGHGTFGTIYRVRWEKNNKQYAMKILKLIKEKDMEDYQNKLNILINFEKNTYCRNIIKVYGTLYEQNEGFFRCFVLMELAKNDWEMEIRQRSKHRLFYTEKELTVIIKQLISCYALLQKSNITHRDVKPQNVLIINNLYKICDFGEAMITHGKNGFIHQPIRGSELYMSPILFDALNHRKKDIIHNTYKSDVFSLGMCIFLAATLTFQSLYDIRELKNMEMIEAVVGNYLSPNYSYNIIAFLIKMLQLEEKKRPDFIQLERELKL